MGFRKGHNPFAVNDDCTRLRLALLLLSTFKNFDNNQPILFFVCHFKLLQICTECPVLKKVEIILFFGSEKLKKLQITFIIMIFQIMPIVRVRAANYLARFVR